MRRCGTYSGYHGGCRCDYCKAANTQYQQSRNWGMKYRPKKVERTTTVRPVPPVRTYGTSSSGIDYDAAIRAAAVAAFPYPESPNRGTKR